MTPGHEEDQRPAEGGKLLKRLAALWQALWKFPNAARRWGKQEGSTGSALPIGFQAPEPVDAWLLWTCQVVWPALRRFAQSRLRDDAPLQRVVRTLPEEEKEAWHAAVNQMLKLQRTLQRNPRVHPAMIFIRLVKLLNETWFIPRQILIACVPVKHGPRLDDNSKIAELIHLVVCRILKQQRFAFQDAEIPAYFVSMVFPPGSHYQPDKILTKNYFDPMSEYVLIDLDFWKAQVLHFFSLSDEKYRQHCLGEGSPPAELSLTVQMAATMCRAFPVPYALYCAQVQRAWCEEVRHGVDNQRVLRGDPDAVLTGDYYARVPEVLLPAGGRLWREVWEPAGNGPSADADQRRYRATSTIQEVSAQLTAAAVGPAPQLLLLEWKLTNTLTLQALSQGRDPKDAPPPSPHEAAARIAITLLGEQLRLAPPLPLAAGGRSDYERLHSLAAALFWRTTGELRLALKEIYRREFVYNQIDEPPFDEIGSQGDHISRLSPRSSGSIDRK